MKYCKVQIHELSWFNHSFIILSPFLTMPKKDKIISINVSRNWKHWIIKTESKTSIPLLYCGICFVLSSYPFVNYLMFLVKSRVEPKLIQYIAGTLIDQSLSGPPKYHSLLASHPAEPNPNDQISLDLHKSLNLNIASYFINTFASPHTNT